MLTHSWSCALERVGEPEGAGAGATAWGRGNGPEAVLTRCR